MLQSFINSIASDGSIKDSTKARYRRHALITLNSFKDLHRALDDDHLERLVKQQDDMEGANKTISLLLRLCKHLKVEGREESIKKAREAIKTRMKEFSEGKGREMDEKVTALAEGYDKNITKVLGRLALEAGSSVGRREKVKACEGIIMVCLLDQHARRAGDLCELSYVDSPGLNYVDLGPDPHIAFRTYKTSKTYGEQKIKLSGTLLGALKQLKQADPNRTFVFCSRRHRLCCITRSVDDHIKMTAAGMANRIDRTYFAELPGMTATRNRKVYASSRATPDEVDRVALTASALSHSVSTMRVHYNKRKRDDKST